MPLTRHALPLAIAALIAGCSSSTAPNTRGSLTVTVSSVANVAPEITITGPKGFKRTITSTTTITGLAVGSYTITASPITTTDSIVAEVYQGAITGSPATVAAGNTATASVSYAKLPGSGALWVVGGYDVDTNVQNMAFSYSASQLRTSGTTAAQVTLTLPLTPGRNFNANDVVFDAQGDMWVVNDNTNTVVEYTPAQLAATNTPAPVTTIQMPAGYTEQIAFDAKGNMWVLNEIAATIVEFPVSELQAGDTLTPAVTITMDTMQGSPGNPLSMAFDAHGNLWVVNGGPVTLIEYAASQLASTGTPTPVLERTLGVMYPYYLAFDAAGNFWIADALWLNNGTPVPGVITEFTAGSINTVTNPAPVVTLPLPLGIKYAAYPTAIAFDNSGNLWYTDFDNYTIGEFAAAQLAAGGSPSPAVTILNSKKFNGTAIAFNPHASALPLH